MLINAAISRTETHRLKFLLSVVHLPLYNRMKLLSFHCQLYPTAELKHLSDPKVNPLSPGLWTPTQSHCAFLSWRTVPWETQAKLMLKQKVLSLLLWTRSLTSMSKSFCECPKENWPSGKQCLPWPLEVPPASLRLPHQPSMLFGNASHFLLCNFDLFQNRKRKIH